MTPQQIALIILLVLAQVILPFSFIYWVGFAKNKSILNLMLKLVSVWAYVFLINDYFPWSFLSNYLRYVIFIALLIASVKAIRRSRNLPVNENKTIGGWIYFVFQCIAPAFFIWFIFLIKKGSFVEEKGIDIAFPLTEGFVGHGGSSTLINYHHADTTAQQYAVDIARLNKWGMRAESLFPEKLEQYTVYGDTLFSPCDGKIVLVKEGIDNIPPGAENHSNPTGNTIVIEYNHHLIVMAHLLKNSITVAAGDVVKTGQPIARIGNSGHTSEPHLHIHAVSGTDTSKILNGNGVPIFFDGKFLTRNETARK